MNKETLKALKGSIEKWKKIERSVLALEKGVANCPLCKIFAADGVEVCCKGCPVAKRVRRYGCVKTPYNSWHLHHMNEHANKDYRGIYCHRVKDCPTCLELATVERKFLESLLPKEATNDNL